AIHVINRGNDRRQLFASDGQYARFLVLIRRAARHHPVDLLAYVLMPNHWHLVMCPAQPEDVSRFLQRLTGAHASRLRRATNTVGEGHVYQDRYRAFLLESEVRLLRTIRYVEANPVRAALVDRAEDWPWSSLAEREGRPRIISPPTVQLPPLAEWLALVNMPVPLPLSSVVRSTRRKK
ncbi:MAG: transposase, partial [Acidobacteriota bacterium]